MLTNFDVKEIKPEHLHAALGLVWKVFSEFEAPEYSDEGIQEFKSFIEFESVKKMYEQRELLLWGCFDREKIIGVIATRKPCHISLLFVDRNFHRQGVARMLFNTVLDYYQNTTECRKISVHSSPYAAEVYHKFGFHDMQPEQTTNGIRFIPMEFDSGNCVEHSVKQE
ncbi:MAG: GNAT family N-acetyltransferase [Clostridia bacterium]|nr:GNAT family N-acetyltransferase [Clostridia bacterium]